MKNLLKLSLSIVFFSLSPSTQAISTAEAKHELFEDLNHQLVKEFIKIKNFSIFIKENLKKIERK